MTMDSVDVVRFQEFNYFTARQYPVDASAIHTLGQLLGATGPFFIVQAFGTLSILLGILLIAFVNFSFALDSANANNYGFGFATGGVFSAITNSYENSRLAESASSSSSGSAGSGSSGTGTGSSSNSGSSSSSATVSIK